MVSVMTNPLTEWDGTRVEGQFYEEDIQRVIVPEDALFHVEKIVQRCDKQVKVRWMDWPSKYDSWIPKLALSSLIGHRKGRT